MKPVTKKIVHSEEQRIYTVEKVESWWTAETWTSKSREVVNTHFLEYAVGEPKDIRLYFEYHHLGTQKRGVTAKIRVRKVTRIKLNHEYDAQAITPELVQEIREIKNLEKEIQAKKSKLMEE